MNVYEAQKAINKILAQLEKDTGYIVTDITLQEIEVTALGDQRSVMNKTVIVDIERTPGSDWSM